MPVSANLAILELFLNWVLSGNIQWRSPPIFVTGSYNATPTHEPSPSVVSASGHLHAFKSAMPTFIMFPIIVTLSNISFTHLKILTICHMTPVLES